MLRPKQVYLPINTQVAGEQDADNSVHDDRHRGLR